MPLGVTAFSSRSSVPCASRSPPRLCYVAVGAALWLGSTSPAWHATITGVILGLLAPARARAAGLSSAAEVSTVETARETGARRARPSVVE